MSRHLNHISLIEFAQVFNNFYDFSILLILKGLTCKNVCYDSCLMCCVTIKNNNYIIISKQIVTILRGGGPHVETAHRTNLVTRTTLPGPDRTKIVLLLPPQLKLHWNGNARWE